MFYLGIDQHCKQVALDLLNQEGSVVLKRPVSAKWDRIHQILQDVVALPEADGGFPAIVKVCGFNDWLLRLLTDLRRQADRAGPTRAEITAEDRPTRCQPTDRTVVGKAGSAAGRPAGAWRAPRLTAHRGASRGSKVDIPARRAQKGGTPRHQQNPADPAEAQPRPETFDKGDGHGGRSNPGSNV